MYKCLTQLLSKVIAQLSCHIMQDTLRHFQGIFDWAVLVTPVFAVR